MKKTINCVRKVICCALSIITVMSMVGSSFAASEYTTDDEQFNALRVMNQLEAEDYGREVTFIPISTETGAVFANSQLFEFDSIEEFENFMQDFVVCLDKAEHADSVLNETTPLTRAAINDSVQWWAPTVGDVFAWKNIAYSYTISKNTNNIKYLSDVTVTNSWINHLAVALTWNHLYGNASDIKSIGDSAGGTGYCTVSASGYWLIGFSIHGFEVGAKVNSTWEKDISISY